MLLETGQIPKSFYQHIWKFFIKQELPKRTELRSYEVAMKHLQHLKHAEIMITHCSLITVMKRTRNT